MDRDHFIITVYCLVCEHYQAIQATCSFRRGGFRVLCTFVRKWALGQFHFRSV